MKTLYFEGAGMDFYEEAAKQSDVGNFRIRTAFTNDEGIQYYIELGRTNRHGYKGKSKKLVALSEWALRVDHLFDLADRDKEFYEMKRDHKEIKELDYTKADITKWINENLNCSFDTIEVLDFLDGYRVHAEGGLYNLIDLHEVNHERTAKRKAAYEKMDQEYRKALNEKYSKIGLLEMDNESITIRCHASSEALEKAGLPRVKTISIEPYGKDLHRKGELEKVEQMEELAADLIKGKDMGIPFITEGYEGFDAYCLVANKPEFVKNQGFVVWDNELNKPVFLTDNE
jgi:hypothetical protein